jgi:hypothetical protein
MINRYLTRYAEGITFIALITTEIRGTCVNVARIGCIIFADIVIALFRNQFLRVSFEL